MADFHDFASTPFWTVLRAPEELGAHLWICFGDRDSVLFFFGSNFFLGFLVSGRFQEPSASARTLENREISQNFMKFSRPQNIFGPKKSSKSKFSKILRWFHENIPRDALYQIWTARKLKWRLEPAPPDPRWIWNLDPPFYKETLPKPYQTPIYQI